MLKDMRPLLVNVHGYSLLVLSQILGEYRCEHESLIQYCALANMLLSKFSDFLLVFSVRGKSK